AFKISYDESISSCPIIEWFPSERVDFTYVRGQIREVIFYTEYTEKRRKYYFAEVYGYGSIRYELYDESRREIPLSSIPQTEWIKEKGWTFDNSYMWAVPLIYGKGDRGRGKSLIDGKEDDFDSLDEIWSQWMDALRSARTKTYMPETYIPFDPVTGTPISPNPFDNRFIAVGADASEGAADKIQTETPQIQDSAYLSSYCTALDLCLQGIISPSTLGIDTKKLDNAEAQREKEKTTLYTRQNFVELIENTLPKLVTAVLNADSVLHGGGIIGDIDCRAKFGEYANPSFESQIETISKARQGGVMSIEASIDELYGDSKSDEWKKEEAERLRSEQGVLSGSEFSERSDLNENGD
ncbi:MAG: capsid protein, partial [Clostridiales bacterium]|nr:capsid protein [Clostridiales bacterium]